MKVLFRFLLISAAAALVLTACGGSGSATNTGNGRETSLPETENLAAHKTVTASSALANNPPGNAVDGVPFTQWDSGAGAPQWIQIDLQTPATVTDIRLTVAQAASGQTLHQLFVGSSPATLRLVQEFNGDTSDSQTLEYKPDVPLNGIQIIKVTTAKSPAAVAWKEIEVYGQSAGTQPPVAVTRPAVAASEPSVGQTADVIYYNAVILTMEPGQPTAQAIALRGDKILAVGSNDEILKLKSDAAKMVDLNGLTVMPGFIDSHAHRIGDRNLYGDNVSVASVLENTLRQGWTSIHELFVTDQRMNELAAFDREHRLPVRVSAYLAVGYDYNYNPWYLNTNYKPLQQFSPYLQIAGIKITLDREWGEQVFFDQSQLNAMVTDAASRGWQVAIHSFSPKANDELLNAYEAALNGGSNDQLRLRLEHTGVMTDAEVQKMARLGIIGSVQLINASLWSEDASFKKYIPADEVQHSARWRDMLDAGIFLIGNTDDPWCCTAWRGDYHPPFDPTIIQSIYQGVTRKNFFDRPPEAWQAAQVLTVDEALRLLTINGAYAAHQENVIGSLKPGKYADLVILSGNPLTTPIEEIPHIQVYMTMVGGQAGYCAEGEESICLSTSQ